MSKDLIEVKNLSASFGAHQVLDNVSFSGKKGAITVLLGASGSGKTTVLKHLLGLYDNKVDTVKVLDYDIGSLDEETKTELYLQMGVFYQNGALMSSLTVGENIALPLQQHTNLSSTLIERLVRLKLQLVNLENCFKLYPAELSGGMLKRAALARAIIMDPPLVFCDEPGAGLDPVTLAALDDLFITLKNQLEITFLVVTHELSSIRKIADKIVFLEHGSVSFEGSIDEITASKSEGLRAFFSY